MIKIYQTIIDPEIGDCHRACVASLFELPLDCIPNFLHLVHLKQMKFWNLYYDFMRWFNYDLLHFTKSQIDKGILNEIEYEKDGISGYFIATVNSQSFQGKKHSVIINKNLEIMHDPNPNNKPPYIIAGIDVLKKLK